ncbi:hypothetical protein RHGRI_004432 [Rhododendron griersonianum]|uniref:Uncharacterized protein n=1 Tax=Rhododendron griersonianum TaxID=479676 RepID=A0AAV6L8M7_9ERIC|nr:hypothetical protein RHGRI_004432 [Rhododendron griersonianum]
MEVLLENPYAQVLRTLENRPVDSDRILIQSSVKLDQRVYNSPSADQVAGIWIEGNITNEPFERDIIIHAHSGRRHRVQHYYGCFEPLGYPALFLRGESGWHQNFMKKNLIIEMGVCTRIQLGPILHLRMIFSKMNKEVMLVHIPLYIHDNSCGTVFYIARIWQTCGSSF